VSFVIVVFVQPNTPCFLDRLVSADSSFCTVALIQFLSVLLLEHFEFFLIVSIGCYVDLQVAMCFIMLQLLYHDWCFGV